MFKYLRRSRCAVLAFRAVIGDVPAVLRGHTTDRGRVEALGVRPLVIGRVVLQLQPVLRGRQREETILLAIVHPQVLHQADHPQVQQQQAAEEAARHQGRARVCAHAKRH
ncbi:hypothetical protein ON010_g6605 [Phytophthora cinnamomi]|nr:hypothetical protein ON010_g6605 [Phytophthora cinnamomi]